MGIRKVSIGFAAAALLGTSPVMAAAPVTPSAANFTLGPVAGANVVAGSRIGVHQSRRNSDMSGGAAVVGVLAAAAVVGGVVAATSGGGHSSVSP